MKEIKEIIQAYSEACKNNKRTALATVIKVEGSAYRRAGARMLITEDGQLTGAISGGCLEGDALRKALLVIARQKPMLVTYDTSDEDDAKLGVGLGCNGIIHILIEPILPDQTNPVHFLKTLAERRQNAVLVTLFSLENKTAPQPGTCLLINNIETKINTRIDPKIQQLVSNDALQVLNGSGSILKIYPSEENYTAFFERIEPPVSLNIIGAGYDAIPLAATGRLLGWEVNVFDGRSNYALKQRFPDAERVVLATAAQVLSHLEVDEQSVFVLLTHNYNYDLIMLKELLPLNIPYIGVLGPKKKLNRMLSELNENNFQISEEQMQKVYGPAGLEIGAETPEEIALSIVAEIRAVLAAKNGGFLRDKQGPIHDAGKDVQVSNLI